MPYDHIFHLVSDVLRHAGVQAVLIGGFAVNFYQFSRTTGDIDFLMTGEDYQRAHPFFAKAGCRQIFQSNLYVSLKSELSPLMPIDIGFVDRKTLEGMIREGKEAVIMECKFVVPSLNHLMEDLNLPIFDTPLPPPPVMPMDQYAQFVHMFVEHLMNRKAYEEERKLSIISVPFRLK